jgi:fucose 4-O-acetylase-like acetyltransferase
MAWITKRRLLFLLGSAGVWVLFAVLNFNAYGTQVDLRLDRLNNYGYFYLAAFGGIVAVIVLSQIIQRNAVLEYLGKQTLVIFAWHLLLFSYIGQMFHLIGLNVLLARLPKFTSPIMYSLTAIGVILEIVFLLRLGRGSIAALWQRGQHHKHVEGKK